MWWSTFIIPALGRCRQKDHGKFQANLVYNRECPKSENKQKQTITNKNNSETKETSSWKVRIHLARTVGEKLTYHA